MIWQDVVIAVVVGAFTAAIVPMVRDGVVVPLATAITMVVGAAALIVAYVTLGLWLSVLIECGTLALWGLLLVRRLRA